jgi:hypothetical protein
MCVTNLMTSKLQNLQGHTKFWVGTHIDLPLISTE